MVQFDVFVAHDWGNDELGRSNHARVARVVAELTAAGLKAWFDEEQMRGDILERMAEGIEASEVVLVFVTERYIKKASGMGEQCADDNWYAPPTRSLSPPEAVRRPGRAAGASLVRQPRSSALRL